MSSSNSGASASMGNLGGAERAIRQDVETLKADLGALRDDLSTLAGHAGEAAMAGIGEAKGRLSNAARSAGAKGREARDAVKTQIEDHPFAAVGIALGAGLLLGALIARR